MSQTNDILKGYAIGDPYGKQFFQISQDKEYLRNGETGNITIIRSGDIHKAAKIYMTDDLGTKSSSGEWIDFAANQISVSVPVKLEQSKTIQRHFYSYKPNPYPGFFCGYGLPMEYRFNKKSISFIPLRQSLGGRKRMPIEELMPNDYHMYGTAERDRFLADISSTKSDVFFGADGDDELVGYRGKDVLAGGDGNDLLRGGNGGDTLLGGDGADRIFGGFGQNTFTGEKDGAIDQLYFKSDKYAYNWIYNKADNQDGSKVDVIGPLDANDRITVQGVSDSLLTYNSTTATVNGQSVSGIGIFAGGTLEAIYTGGNLSTSQLDMMTFGSTVA